MIRIFALLEMAWYIAIQHHDNPVTQHGFASYTTKLLKAKALDFNGVQPMKLL